MAYGSEAFVCGLFSGGISLRAHAKDFSSRYRGRNDATLKDRNVNNFVTEDGKIKSWRKTTSRVI